MQRGRHAVLLFVVCLVAIAGVAAAATTEVTIDGSKPVPEQTTTYQGTEYTVTAVKVADPGESISIGVTTTSDESYFVDVRNADDQVVDSKDGEGNRTFTLTLDDYAAGSFVVAVDIDGEYVDAHPLVVRGYEVTIDAPDSAEDRLNATVSTTYLRGNRSDDVEVVVGDDENIVREDATKEAPGTYTASVPVDSLPSGTYQVHGTVRGEDEAFGERELIGLSSPSTVEIEGSGGSTGSTGSTGGSGGGGGFGGGSTGGTATPTTNTTATTTDDGGTGTGTADPSDEGTATDDGVITPADIDTGTDTTTTTDGASTADGTVTRETANSSSGGLAPGFGLTTAVAAVLAAGVGLLARRR